MWIGTMKILIVDDVPLIRNMLEHILKPFGEVDIAEDGMQAINKVTQKIRTNEPYDLISLDILLPFVDGVEVLKKIREVEQANKVPELKKSKVVMVTTLNDRIMVMRCLEAGCDGFIGKPFSKEKIIEEIHKLGLISTPQENNTTVS